jgi:hypothetical protein
VPGCTWGTVLHVSRERRVMQWRCGRELDELDTCHAIGTLRREGLWRDDPREQQGEMIHCYRIS